jgi:hypothetical protein
MRFYGLNSVTEHLNYPSQQWLSDAPGSLGALSLYLTI